jgi:RNA polymerase sigma factor (sigma-70 family)
MTTANHGAALRQLRTLLERGSIGQLSDTDLIDRFLARSPEEADAAFAALVERHGSAVFRVCRSVLGDPEAAQDAFQATFLVLVRKAGSVRVRESIGPWLVAVAYRTASGARSAASRRRVIEREAAEVRAQAEPSDEELAREVRAEVDRLADRYRRPILLCYFAGLTHEGAARQLGCPVGTVRSRLAWGRKQLRDRLIRRGFGLSAALAATPGRAAVPTSLLIRAARVGAREAAGAVSAGAVVQAERVVRAMFMTKLKGIAAALLTLTLVATGGGVLAQQQGENPASDSAAGTKGSEAQDLFRQVRRGRLSLENVRHAPPPKVRPDVELEMLLRAAGEQEQAGHLDQALALTARMSEALEAWRTKLQRDATRTTASREEPRASTRPGADVTDFFVTTDNGVSATETTAASKANPAAGHQSGTPAASPSDEPGDRVSVDGPATLMFDRNNGHLILRGTDHGTDIAFPIRPEAPTPDKPAGSGSTRSIDAAPRSSQPEPDRPSREGEAAADSRGGFKPRLEYLDDSVRLKRDGLGLRDVERELAPFPRTQTIKEPAGNRLFDGTKEKRRNQTAPKRTTAQIQAALDRKIAVAIGGPSTVLDAIEIIQTVSRGPGGVIPISLDLNGLRRDSIKLDRPAVLESRGITVAAALKAVLEPAGLTYQVEDGQVVIGVPRSDPTGPPKP